MAVEPSVCFHSADAAIDLVMAHAIASAGLHLLRAANHPTRHGGTTESRSLGCGSAPAAHSQCIACGGTSGTSSGVRNHGRPFCNAVVGHGEGSSLFLEELEFDVIIVGAGVVGLTVANRILEDSTFSVAVVDAKRPCAGATGAGEFFVISHNFDCWFLSN